MSVQKKVFVKTYGCQMNVYDSERIAELLAPAGYAATEAVDDADLIVLNDVSDTGIGFDSDENAVTLVTGEDEREVARAAKSDIADRILDRVLEIRGTDEAP